MGTAICAFVYLRICVAQVANKTTGKKQIHKRHHLMELFDKAHLCICLFVYSPTKSQPNRMCFSLPHSHQDLFFFTSLFFLVPHDLFLGRRTKCGHLEDRTLAVVSLILSL